MSRKVIIVILLPLTIGLFHLLVSVLPFGWKAGAAIEVPTQHPGMNGGTARFYVQALGMGRHERMRFTSAYVVYSGVERPGALDVDFKTMTYRLGLNGYDHLPARGLTLAAVQDYISRGGFDPTTVEGKETAEAIYGELYKLSVGILPPEVTGEATYTQRPLRTYSMAGESYVSLGEYGHLIWLPWYWPACLLTWLLAAAAIVLSTSTRDTQHVSPNAQ